jgi:hypothetical protein
MEDYDEYSEVEDDKALLKCRGESQEAEVIIPCCISYPAARDCLSFLEACEGSYAGTLEVSDDDKAMVTKQCEIFCSELKERPKWRRALPTATSGGLSLLKI